MSSVSVLQICVFSCTGCLPKKRVIMEEGSSVFQALINEMLHGMHNWFVFVKALRLENADHVRAVLTRLL